MDGRSVAQARLSELYGTAALMGVDDRALHQIAKDCGIDTDEYRPIGMCIYGPGLNVSILAARSGPSEQTDSAVERRALEQGALRLTAIPLSETLPELCRQLEHVELTLTTKLVADLAEQSVKIEVVDSLGVSSKRRRGSATPVPNSATLQNRGT